MQVPSKMISFYVKKEQENANQLLQFLLLNLAILTDYYILVETLGYKNCYQKQ